MKLFIDFIPLLLFFISYKLYGVQIAAIILVIATIVQLIIMKLIYKKIEKQLLITSAFIIVFSSLTAYFNNPEFLIIKVNIVYALFAGFLLIGQIFFNKIFIKLLLGKELTLPDIIWKKINFGWGIFFLLCIVLNSLIAHYFSLDVWIKFKVFGLLGITLIPTIITGIVILPYLKEPENSQKTS